MKLVNVDNPERLLQIINSCQGPVDMVTPDGKTADLKAELGELVALAGKFDADIVIKQLDVVTHNSEDNIKIVAFSIDGH